jgi:hypothetical protein
MRKAAVAMGLALGLYLIVRAAAEPFVIDLSDPAIYRDDWGGPSLLGVLLVHSGSGVVAAIAITIALIRRRSPGHAQPKQPSRPQGHNHPPRCSDMGQRVRPEPRSACLMRPTVPPPRKRPGWSS